MARTRVRGTDPIVNAVEARIDAVPGRTLVVPIELGPRFDPRVPVPVRLGDGRQLYAQVHRVTVRPEDPAGHWLPPAGRWESATAAAALENPEVEPGTLASWMLLVALPPGASGRMLQISGRQVNVNWLSSVSGTGVVRPADEKALGPLTLRTSTPTPATERLLDAERTSPVRRWRYRLYTDGLTRAPDAVGEKRFSDPVLEAIAVQNEDRWEFALRTIWKSDRELAERLARRLVMVADFGNGVVAPAWPTSQGEVGSLLSDLLDPRLDERRRAARAESWLEAQIHAVGWVIDDAGAQDGVSGASLTTVGLADLGDRDVAAFASARAGGQPSTVVTLPAGIVERMLVAASDGTRWAPEIVDLRVGRWSGAVSAFAGRLAAQPPGVAIGPLVPDYSEETWVGAGAPGENSPAPDPRWLTAGLVYRRSGAPRAGVGDWVLHFECLRPKSPDGQAPSREDTVRIWIGLTGRPRLVLRVGESGYAHIESMRGSRGDTATAEAFGVSVVSRPGKWVCQVPIPAVCFEADGTLRLGLERIDSRGQRSAFPRPMLPWQTEPGRLAIDASTW